MKYMVSLLLVVVIATATLAACPKKCGLPSCKACTEHKPHQKSHHHGYHYRDHHVEREEHHHKCGVRKPVYEHGSEERHHVSGEVHHHRCGVPTCHKCPKLAYAHNSEETHEPHHHRCREPTCKKCTHHNYHHNSHESHEEMPHHHRCHLPGCKKCVKLSHEHSSEESHEVCPPGYGWNGYFCSPNCKGTAHKPPHYYKH